MDAGNESVGGGTTERNEEGGKEVKKKKNTRRHFVLLQDVLQFRIFPSPQINRPIEKKSGLGKLLRGMGKHL